MSTQTRDPTIAMNRQVVPPSSYLKVAINLSQLLLQMDIESAENFAMFALTDLVKTYVQKLAFDIKSVTEQNGRYDSNVIDALCALNNNNISQQQVADHLSDNPFEMRLYNTGNILSSLDFCYHVCL